MIFKENVLMKDYTTYKIGGPARYFFSAKTREDLILAIESAKKKNLKVFILGGGSNVLFSDKGFDGLVIKIQDTRYKIQNGELYAEAGATLAELVRATADAGLSGLEWAAGIPNVTLGGAIFGNAQAFGSKTSDFVNSVEALDTETLEIKNFSKEGCQFSLKNSIFKKNKNLVILSAVLQLEQKPKEEIGKKVGEVLAYRKSRHPADPSAGSVFINPEDSAGQVTRVGALIEQCGLKGKKIGGAQISEQHANFIVNTGNATAEDVIGLIKLVKQEVKEKFKINLETEIIMP